MLLWYVAHGKKVLTQSLAGKGIAMYPPVHVRGSPHVSDAQQSAPLSSHLDML